MKKIFSTILILAMIFGLGACGNKTVATPVDPFADVHIVQDESGRFIEGKAEISVAAGEERLVRDNSYNDPVVIKVTGTLSKDNLAIVRFINCDFKQGLTLECDKDAIVVIESDCVVNGLIAVDSAIKEATDDSEICKIISMVPAQFAAENTAGFMIYDSETLELNGKSFVRAYSSYCYSDATGYVPYVAGDYNMFYVAQWWENGTWKTFTSAQTI